jgi:hypothetical protein
MEAGSVARSPVVERVLLVIVLAALGLQVGYLAAVWSVLPSLVPTHFDWSGHADTWSRKTHLISLVGIPALIVFFLLGIRGGVRKLAEKREGSRPFDRYLGSMLLGLALAITALFGWVELRSVQVAFDQADGLGKGFVWAVLGLSIASAPLLLVVLRWRRRLDAARPVGGEEGGAGA